MTETKLVRDSERIGLKGRFRGTDGDEHMSDLRDRGGQSQALKGWCSGGEGMAAKPVQP